MAVSLIRPQTSIANTCRGLLKTVVFSVSETERWENELCKWLEILPARNGQYETRTREQTLSYSLTVKLNELRQSLASRYALCIWHLCGKHLNPRHFSHFDFMLRNYKKLQNCDRKWHVLKKRSEVKVVHLYVATTQSDVWFVGWLASIFSITICTAYIKLYSLLSKYKYK